MKVVDLFDVEYGVNLELQNCEEASADDVEGVNFVARTASNNGVVAVVKRIDGIVPQKAGTLSCAAGGSVLETFVQTKPYYSGRDLYVLTPKKAMTIQEKLFYCMCIKANAYRYCYGRQANKTLKSIELPSIIPPWVNSTHVSPITTANKKENALILDTTKWEYFGMGKDKGGLFKLERCKNGSSGDLVEGDDCYYLGAKKSENCVMRRVVREDSLITKGNCIVFIGNGEGSVGYSNYMNEDFIGTADLTVGYNEHLNPFTGLFIVTVLDLERPKYSFGRKWSARIADTKIKLPTTEQGSPDWLYMEQYIKSLPFGDKIRM